MSPTEELVIWGLLILGFCFLTISTARLLIGADFGHPRLLRASLVLSLAQIASCVAIAAASA